MRRGGKAGRERPRRTVFALAALAHVVLVATMWHTRLDIDPAREGRVVEATISQTPAPAPPAAPARLPAPRVTRVTRVMRPRAPAREDVDPHVIRLAVPATPPIAQAASAADPPAGAASTPALLVWSISQPDMGTIDAANAFVWKHQQIDDSPAIYFYTDAAGRATDWFVNAEVLDPSSPPDSFLFSKWAQSWNGVVLGAPPLAYGIYAEEAADGGFNANDPGTWTASGGVLRDFGYGDRADLATLTRPVPEPPAGWLALLGSGALAVLRRKAWLAGPVDRRAC